MQDKSIKIIIVEAPLSLDISPAEPTAASATAPMSIMCFEKRGYLIVIYRVVNTAIVYFQDWLQQSIVYANNNGTKISNDIS